MRWLLTGSLLSIAALACASNAGSSEPTAAPSEASEPQASDRVGVGIAGAPKRPRARNWWIRGKKSCPGAAVLTGKPFPAGQRIACTLADGTAHGRATSWWPNGNKKRFDSYRKGTLQGPFVEWYSDGRIARRGLYRAGLRVGQWTEWYRSGKRIRQGRYASGKRYGQWRWWSADGSLIGAAPRSASPRWWVKSKPCPRGTTLRGAAPPKGRSVECVGPAGPRLDAKKPSPTRHGNRATWNRFNQLATLETYDQGDLRSKKELHPWRFVVLSDIHIYPSGRIPKFAKPVIDFVTAMKPRAVLITGDSTNGNKGDRYGAKRIALWWQRLHLLLDPLYKAGIPVLPMAGNHDSYRKEHREGYAAAWKDLTKRAAPLSINPGGNPPWYYSIDIGGTHLNMLNLVTQRIDKAQEAWLRSDLAGSKKSTLRLAFGHAPISSVIASPIKQYRKHMMALFGGASVHAYICGHEHVLWDETLQEDGNKVRQVITGTASGTYHFGIRGAVKRKWCQNRTCRFPENGYGFRIKSTREQVLRASFVAVDVIENGTAIQVHPYSLGRDGTVALFPRAPPSGAATPSAVGGRRR